MGKEEARSVKVSSVAFDQVESRVLRLIQSKKGYKSLFQVKLKLGEAQEKRKKIRNLIGSINPHSTESAYPSTDTNQENQDKGRWLMEGIGSIPPYAFSTIRPAPRSKEWNEDGIECNERFNFQMWWVGWIESPISKKELAYRIHLLIKGGP